MKLEWIPAFKRLQTSKGKLTDLQTLRDWIGDILVFVAVFGFPLSMVASFPVFARNGQYGLVILDLFVWLALIVRVMTKDWLPVKPFLLGLIVVYTMTVIFFITLGPTYGRSGWLVLCAVMVALYFGMRATLLAVAANCGLLIVFYFVLDPGNTAWAEVHSHTFRPYLMYIVNITLVTLGASAPVAFTIDKLDLALKSERRARTDLSAEREKLDQVNNSLRKEIEDKKRTARELRESELRFRRTFYEAPIGAAIVGFDGKVLQVNEELCRFLQCRFDKLEGQPFLGFLADGGRSEVPEAFNRIGRGELDLYYKDERFLCGSGEIKWGRISVRSIKDQAGAPLYYLPMVEDVNSQRLMESEKDKLENLLNQAQKMEALGTLASGIAHDFSNILTIILGRSEVILLKNVDARINDDLHSILSAATRANDLVRRILTFSRRSEPSRRSVDIRATLDEALKMLRPAFPANIDLELDFAPEVPPALADPIQIHQIIMNLCANAFHAIGDRPGTIRIVLNSIHLADMKVERSRAPHPGEYVHLAVKDTGVGISEEHHQKIFEPYYTSKPLGEGTGLGLAVVQGLVTSMGGFIEVDSAPGQGAAFHIYLPAVDVGIDKSTL